MLLYGVKTLPYRFRLVLASLQQSDILPFSDALTEEQIDAAFKKAGASWDEDDLVFTPAITLWAFLSQFFYKQEQRSCLAAVARIGVLLVAMGHARCAQNSGPYCRARARLPLAAVIRLTRETAQRAESQVPEEWLWNALHVKLIDGTTVKLADTEENQDAYPQSSCQKEGLGFPMARAAVTLSYATGMVLEMEMGPYSGKETGELALLRRMVDQFQEGNLALADRLYCDYFTIAAFTVRSVNVVVRLHHLRKENALHKKRLGPNGDVLEWKKPARPSWMDQDAYDALPDAKRLRLVSFHVEEKGFRTRNVSVVTTLEDATAYSADEIASLYRCRWLAELDIRAIKSTMGLDELRCKSPEMAKKELWAGLLAYNVVRQKMMQSAVQQEISPRRLSFANAMQMLAAAWGVAPVLDRNTTHELLRSELTQMAKQIIGKRPNRIEPRAVKRRPKPFHLLTMARQAAQKLLRKGVALYQKQK